MEKIKNLALVAHDNRKADLIEWVGSNYESISTGSDHHFCAIKSDSSVKCWGKNEFGQLY